MPGLGPLLLLILAPSVDPNASVLAAPDTLVVCPAEFRAALNPWLAFRSAQGHRLSVAAPPASAEALGELVKSTAKGGSLKWVVLVGDAGEQRTQVPTSLIKARVNIHWGSDPLIATDNAIADLDGDQIPDVAVGRLPADTPEQLAAMVHKILRYERELDHGVWRRRINIVAGVGGFGLIDHVLESITKRFLTDFIPAEFDTTMTYGSWRSPFCPRPDGFHRTTMARLNEGCLFWVYIGHGHRLQLDQIRVPGGRYHILNTHDAPRLQARNPAVAILLACHTGSFDSPQDCLAEELLRSDGGPVAVFSGSRVTMPYAMSLLSLGLMREYFDNRRATLGEVLLHAKRSMALPSDEDQRLGSTRQLLDIMARALSPRRSLLEAERLEHLSLFNLLGDPLLRMRRGGEVEIKAPEEAEAGATVQIQGQCLLPGALRVELICRRDQHKTPPAARPAFDARDGAMMERFDQGYLEANDRTWMLREYQFQGGPFQLQLEVPEQCQGDCYVRVFVEGREDFALGAAAIKVISKAPPVGAEAPVEAEPAVAVEAATSKG